MYGQGEAVVSAQPYHRIGNGYEQLAPVFNLILPTKMSMSI